MSIEGDPPRAWQSLLQRAVVLIDHVSAMAGEPVAWSLGGGTVLMLRLNHRASKDIDIFLPDPQFLGFFNPRISEAAHDVTEIYEESAGHVKLHLSEGEIDFVVAEPLTTAPFESTRVLDREVVMERSGEIIAKKMWHRGHLATARDLFDLAAVNELEPTALNDATPFLGRHSGAFLEQIRTRDSVLRRQFEAIDRLACALTFDECREIATHVLTPLGHQR